MISVVICHHHIVFEHSVQVINTSCKSMYWNV